MIITDPKESFVLDLITYVTTQIPSLMNQGISGYTLVTRDMQSPIQLPGIPDRVAGFMGTCILQDVDNLDVITKAFNPINDTIHERWSNKAQFYTSINQYDSFLGWFNNNFDSSPAGGSLYIVSRLLDGETLTGNPEKLKSALQAAMTSGGTMSAFMVAGKGVQEAKPRGGSNAVNPAWRTAYVHACKLRIFCNGRILPVNDTTNSDKRIIWTV
jgi:hypothetical protein